ncbi:hypothetical protein, partial [Pseudomonas putida]|uniref:hypothetical protein n=1 Tax=Pseudomonas putida TaxID=303 RepID=UPI0021190A60
ALYTLLHQTLRKFGMGGVNLIQDGTALKKKPGCWKRAAEPHHAQGRATRPWGLLHCLPRTAVPIAWKDAGEILMQKILILDFPG